MPAAVLESTTAISSPRMKSIAAWEDNRENNRRTDRSRLGESRQENSGQHDSGQRGGGDVSQQSPPRSEGRGPPAQRRLGGHAGAIPDRQEVGRRRSRRRLDRAQARRTPRAPPPSQLR